MKYFNVVLIVFALISCKSKSTVSGWKHNTPENGGFMKTNFKTQEVGPGLTFIKGGSFKHNKQETLMHSFFMDVTEVTNHNWNEYLYWTEKVFIDFPAVHTNALPNKKVWLENGVYNEPYINNYFNYPAYDDYPVVGVSWLQANNFCAWRTDRVNEMILIREKILLYNNNQQNEPFTTEAYLAGQYENGKNEKGQLVDLNPNQGSGASGKNISIKDLATRNVKIEDGMLLPKYRLPTAAEWTYASNIKTNTTLFWPWKGKGIHKNYNDNKLIQDGKIGVIKPVDSYWPNDYGLYNMNSNVSEWVMDDYYLSDNKKNNSSIYNPVNGNDILVRHKNELYRSADKLDEALYDAKGVLQYLTHIEKNENKIMMPDAAKLNNSLFDELIRQSKTACHFDTTARKLAASRTIREILETTIPNFLDQYQSIPGMEDADLEFLGEITDGIAKCIISTPGRLMLTKDTTNLFNKSYYLLTDEMRYFIPYYDYTNYNSSDNKLFMGKSWRDTTQATQIRYLNKQLSSSTIGFRCAMDCLGIPSKKAMRKNKRNRKNITYFTEDKKD